MIILSSVWEKSEGASLLSTKKQGLSVGDVITCQCFEYEKHNDKAPFDTRAFKVIVDNIRETIALLYEYNEAFVSDDYGTSFTITALRDFQKEVLPSLKDYNVDFYGQVIRKSDGVPNKFLIAQLDKSNSI